MNKMYMVIFIINYEKLDWIGGSDGMLKRKCHCDFVTEGGRNAEQFILLHYVFYLNLTSL